MKTEKINQDETELHALKQFEKQTKFVGSKSLRPGHKCFEINTKTLECTEAKFQSEVHFNAPTTRRVIIKDGFSYVNALNVKNALKVYTRSLTN